MDQNKKFLLSVDMDETSEQIQTQPFEDVAGLSITKIFQSFSWTDQDSLFFSHDHYLVAKLRIESLPVNESILLFT